MTLAHKSKSKITKIFAKYGNNLNIKDSDGKTIAKFQTLTNSSFRNSKRTNNSCNVTQLILKNLKLAKKSVVKMPCIICGDPLSEMHHIKSVRKTLKKKVPKSFNYYMEVMRLVNRKVIPVCKYHHNLIHAGKYDGVSLKLMFQNFKQQGYNFNQIKADALIKKASFPSDKKK